MEALKSLLLSDNIILTDSSYYKYKRVVEEASNISAYEFSTHDFYNDDRRYNFVGELVEQARNSRLSSILFADGALNNIVDNYTHIIVEALKNGYTDMVDFLKGDTDNLELCVFLFLLNDDVLPVQRGFSTLRKRIVAKYKAITEEKKRNNPSFEIKEVFKDIRIYETPAKTRKTDSQMQVRAIRRSKIVLSSDERITPQTYVSIVAAIIYNNNDMSKERRQVLKCCEAFYNKYNIKNMCVRTRLSEIILYSVQNPDCTYDEIKEYIKKMFAIETEHMCRSWISERDNKRVSELKKLLKRKYGRPSEKALIKEAIYQVKTFLGIYEEDILINTMRGE